MPPRPKWLCIAAIETSESHSQANHGWPSFVNEKRSVAGTRRFFNIHSPVRTCQPVSESVSSQATPVGHQNKTRIGIKKERSDRDGARETQRPSGSWRGRVVAFLSRSTHI